MVARVVLSFRVDRQRDRQTDQQTRLHWSQKHPSAFSKSYIKNVFAIDVITLNWYWNSILVPLNSLEIYPDFPNVNNWQIEINLLVEIIQNFWCAARLASHFLATYVLDFCIICKSQIGADLMYPFHDWLYYIISLEDIVFQPILQP